MGKKRPSSDRPGCSDTSAPICGSDCCITETLDGKRAKDDVDPSSRHLREQQTDIQELVVIGVGPHGHALLLRLLEPDADFLSDKERHIQAEYTDRMRPLKEVVQHVRKLSRGPRAILRTPSKKSQRGKKKCEKSAPPPLTLEEVQKSVLVVDAHGGWMRGWKENFKSLRIETLRSLMNAHTDPFDHRSLEFFAEAKGRGEELVTLPSLSQRDKLFKGPYQVPSTAIFNRFHEVLSRAYGIEDAVCTGTVQSINPIQEDEESVTDEPIFEVKIAFGKNSPHGSPTDVRTVRTIYSRRVVFAMGPMFRPLEAPWEASLRQELGADHSALRRILHAHQILPFVNKALEVNTNDLMKRVLVVGGGITSAQLALLAKKSSWCKEVTLIQRSKMVPRHFDIDNMWMGPKRGKLQEDFWSLDMQERAQRLKEARGGGTIPPETIQELLRCRSTQLQVKEEVEILEVHWTDGRFHISLDDGSECEPYDMIWLATGAQNHIDHYSALSHLRRILPVSVTNGLPVLNTDLSWRAPVGEETTDEPIWKQVARERIWCMGALAALELGPDALNLIGARHGSVRVAEAIRRDCDNQRDKIDSLDVGEDEDCGCC
mmetsp:Transcript_17435/g.28317  ORF Transcript_17435/g.28317 Transcript_17435/m.28317 type:complete len:602 (+) Transcript_17435:84-1889(+)